MDQDAAPDRRINYLLVAWKPQRKGLSLSRWNYYHSPVGSIGTQGRPDGGSIASYTNEGFAVALQNHLCNNAPVIQNHQVVAAVSLLRSSPFLFTTIALFAQSEGIIMSESQFLYNFMKFCYDNCKTPDMEEVYEFDEPRAREMVDMYIEEHHKTYGEVEFMTLEEEHNWYKYLEEYE